MSCDEYDVCIILYLDNTIMNLCKSVDLCGLILSLDTTFCVFKPGMIDVLI